jgi:hypothetical protein
MGVSGQFYAPAALYPLEKDPLYPLYRRLETLHTVQYLCDCYDMGFSPLKTNLVQIIVKNSVRTSKRTPHFAIKISTG